MMKVVKEMKEKQASIETLIEKYKYYCALLGQEAVVHTTPQHDGTPHVEVVGGKYHYVVTERGREFERRVTESEDEILYWLVSDLVFDLATKYELEHRVPGRDSRRLLFAKEIELMERVNPEWAERTRQKIRNILKEYPYRDRGTES